MFQKVLVIGCPGAGKSTFARRLRDATGLPLHYLDMLWHRPDRTTASQEEFDAALRGILRQDRWILDGNYLRTLELRLSACDAVFLLDFPPEVCLAGAEARIGTAREDMPWVERSFDPAFRQWIEDFPKDQLPRIRRLLRACLPSAAATVFHSRREAEDWLAALPPAAQRKENPHGPNARLFRSL